MKRMYGHLPGFTNPRSVQFDYLGTGLRQDRKGRTLHFQNNDFYVIKTEPKLQA